MKTRLVQVWRAFANVATVFSFIVNFILVVVLLLAIGPLFQAKAGLLTPLLNNLDRAFQGLGETNIQTIVPVNNPIAIQFDLPLNQPLPLDFDLPINQPTTVVLTQDVPLSNMQARFTLPYGVGVINGTVSLSLPSGMRLPIMLDMVVPVENTIPVSMTVPVNTMVPVQMNIPVVIQLGPAGLDPAVQRLRGVFTPLRDLLDKLPDGISLK